MYLSKPSPDNLKPDGSSDAWLDASLVKYLALGFVLHVWNTVAGWGLFFHCIHCILHKYRVLYGINYLGIDWVRFVINPPPSLYYAEGSRKGCRWFHSITYYRVGSIPSVLQRTSQALSVRPPFWYFTLVKQLTKILGLTVVLAGSATRVEASFPPQDVDQRVQARLQQ